MRFFRRIAGLLGLAKDEQHEVKDAEEDEGKPDYDVNAIPASHLPREGFSVSVQVPVVRAPVGPILRPCSSAHGGVQGLRWYADCLRVDEDGDVADEFLNEVQPESLNVEEADRSLPRFEVKCNTTPAKVTKQALSVDGKIQQAVDYQGRLLWV